MYFVYWYISGRGKNTHAYTHSVHDDHHVYLNLHTLRAFCLPDNYEIIDATLEDIKYVLKPTFTQEEVSSFQVWVWQEFNLYIMRVLEVCLSVCPSADEAGKPLV